jgi:hypothetical protein
MVFSSYPHGSIASDVTGAPVCEPGTCSGLQSSALDRKHRNAARSLPHNALKPYNSRLALYFVLSRQQHGYASSHF